MSPKFFTNTNEWNLFDKFKVKEASFASNWLNYKLLSKMHKFRNNEEIDWFPLFDSEVLPFIRFREPVIHAEKFCEEFLPKRLQLSKD